jgi:hypothetical protein
MLGDSTELAYRILMLSEEAEEVARAWTPRSEGDRLLRRLALGDPTGVRAANAMEEAIIAGFGPPDPPSEDGDPEAAAASNMSVGEVVLEVAQLLQRGIESDPGDVTRALQLLLSYGFEAAARAAALELLLLGDEA